MQEINEIQRVEQDRKKFNTIVEAIGINNAIGQFNELESVTADFKKVQLCRALIVQHRNTERKENKTAINKLLNGNKIKLSAGGVFYE